MKKRNVLFVMSSLRNGGAERSLVNLLQLLDYDRYNVDLLLFQNEGMFLKQVPKAVNTSRIAINYIHCMIIIKQRC